MSFGTNYIFPLLMAVMVIFSFSCETTNENSSKTGLETPDTIVIHGKVVPPVPTDGLVELAINRVGLGQEKLTSDLGGDGTFSFKFMSYVPLDAYLIYEDMFLIGARPGDSLFVQIEKNEDNDPVWSILFEGDRAGFNKQITAFQKEIEKSGLFNNDELIEHAARAYGPEDFRAFIDSLRDGAQAIYNRFVIETDPLPAAKSWASFYLRRRYFSELVGYPSSHRMALVKTEREWDVPLSYFNFLEQVGPLNNDSLIAALSISSIADSRLYRDFQSAKKKFDDMTPQHIKDSITLRAVGKLTNDPLLREIELTFLVFIELMQQNVKFFERNQKYLEDNITRPFLIGPLREKYNETVLELEKISESSVSGESTSEYLSGIIKANRGKPLFVDVWATWCGPCLKEMPYSKKLQEEFDDIVFVYLCIESEEGSARAVLEKHGITGKQYYLNDAESKQLRNDLNIMGIPHYILIDRDGKIVSKGWKDKPSADQTQTRLKELQSNRVKLIH